MGLFLIIMLCLTAPTITLTYFFEDWLIRKNLRRIVREIITTESVIFLATLLIYLFE